MYRSRLNGALCAGLILIATTSQAALIGVLPATPGGTNYQTYYDDQLDITWANPGVTPSGTNTWENQMDWAVGLTIGGVNNWRLANMDVNGDGSVVGECHLPME